MHPHFSSWEMHSFILLFLGFLSLSLMPVKLGLNSQNNFLTQGQLFNVSHNNKLTMNDIIVIT